MNYYHLLQLVTLAAAFLEVWELYDSNTAPERRCYFYRAVSFLLQTGGCIILGTADKAHWPAFLTGALLLYIVSLIALVASIFAKRKKA